MSNTLDGKSPETTPVLKALTINDDDRGSVREAYRESWFPALPPVVQVVHSESHAGVLRAMHAHKTQFDIWHFTTGRAQVQLYDHRDGYWQNLVLDSDHTLVIPPGVSHGFLALTPVTLTYYLTSEYTGLDEFGWNALDRKWPGGRRWRHRDIYKPQWFGFGQALNVPYAEGDLIRSKRDLDAPSLGEFASAWS